MNALTTPCAPKPVNKRLNGCARFSVLVVSSLLLSGCYSLFFYPQKTLVATPADLGYAYQDVFLTSDDGIRLHAWLVSPDTDAYPDPVGSVLQLHGNAENISTHIRSVLWLVDQGYEVLTLDYRGYGISQGSPDLPEVFLDIDAATRWLWTHTRTEQAGHHRSTGTAVPVPQRPLYLLGQSLGASLAAGFAALTDDFAGYFDALILEAPFARYDTMASDVASRHWITWLARFPALWFIRGDYDPVDAVRTLESVPVMVIHSKDDQVVPYRFGRAVYEAANEPKAWLDAAGPHLAAAADPAIRAAVLSFMQSTIRASSASQTGLQKGFPKDLPKDSATGSPTGLPADLSTGNADQRPQ